METEDLRNYIQVAASQSFSLGAGSRGIGQPSATRSVRRLESELKVTLIDRKVRPIQMTLQGIEFLKFARETINHLEILTRDFQKPDPNIQGTLNIITSSTPGELLVPHMLNDFLIQFPLVRPRVVTSDSNEVYFQLLSSNYDVGFVGSFNPNNKLRFLKIAEDEIMLAVGRNHKFFNQHKIKVSELAGERLILRDKGSGTLRTLSQALKLAGLKLPDHKIAMVVGDTRAVLNAVKENIGSGFVSSLALQSESMSDIHGIEIEDLNLKRNLFIVYQKNHPNLRIIQEFIRFAPETTGLRELLTVETSKIRG